jgi:hypothetical protein
MVWRSSAAIGITGSSKPLPRVRFDSNVVSLNFMSWNQLDGWLRQVEGLKRVA